ncbi:tetratricopeptide-like helical protein [Diplodia corticola]|uniref:Tetratricopeptide-like helical protein n=1 Tax=Diplodia corticola TaxID=236234 RepID=A0A1J9RWW7_9PEZI|nr:tetratricopeptide-like helical protein [Diplodia corticola]OJD31981.1 tetratricopeptide-like helical protein [Diplodia corticola]
MLSQQLSRPFARPITRPRPRTNVCICCRSAGVPDVFRRHYAKATPRKAPSTKAEAWRNRARVMTASEKQRAQAQGVQAVQARSGKLLPNFELLRWLKKSGLVQADPEKALVLLDEMRELSSKLDGSAARKLCKEHQIDHRDMYFFARACLYHSNHEVVRKLGKTLLLAASANQIDRATLYLLRMADRQDRDGGFRLRMAYNSPELAVARRHLQRLVDSRHLEAMVFRAKRMAAEGNTQQAIRILEVATESQGAEYQDHEAMHHEYSGHFFKDIEESRSESPWTMLATLYSKQGNFAAAEHAFSLGMEKHDDPRAFQGFAAIMTDKFSPLWVEYMTKAAASGSWTAAKSLGEFYSAPLEQIPEKLRHEMWQLETHGAAVEWWYYCLSNEELKYLDKPPGTKLIRADHWRPYKDPATDSALFMAELNPRQALAMEWYDIAWRGQYCFSDEENTLINEAMQKIVDEATSQSFAGGGLTGSRAGLPSKLRHYDQHHLSTEKHLWERAAVELDEFKKRIFG